MRQLFLFDLVRLSLLPSAPADIRRVAEEVILTRVPHLPVGEKLTLARRGPARVAGAILAEGHAQAIKLALANAFLTESQVLRVLAKAGRAGTGRRRGCPASEMVLPVQCAHRAGAQRAYARGGCAGFFAATDSGRFEADSKLEGLAPHLKKQMRDEIVRRANERGDGRARAARSGRSVEISWHRDQIKFDGSSGSERSRWSGMLAYSTMQQTRERYEVCVQFKGAIALRHCRPGSSYDQAVRSAQEIDCQLLSNGRDENMVCLANPPASVRTIK